jgi:hypothetical protein
MDAKRAPLYSIVIVGEGCASRREREREERARKIESFGVNVAVARKIHDAREESVSRRSCC